MSATEPHADVAHRPKRALSLLDSTSIIVGIIIGSTIYESSPDIAAGCAQWANHWSPWLGGSESAAALEVVAILGVWVAGGLIALLGAMCYAELATAYPRAGGTYVFLSEAFGRDLGFAFAWVEFWIVRPGNVGAIAFVLANYGRQIVAPQTAHVVLVELLIALGAIIVLSALNAVGLRTGTRTQNLLTGSKLLGLAAIVLTAVSLPRAAVAQPIVADPWENIMLSLILVMFAYGGWADMSFVAAEVREPEKNISRALILGTLAVMTIYLAVNAAFLWVFGVGGLTAAQAVAAQVMALRFGPAGATLISLLVVISCLGAINGMTFTGSRVYYALGEQHPTFRWLGVWDQHKGIPLRSLLLQAAVTVLLVFGFGRYPGGFKSLVVFTGPFYWGFIGLVGLALIRLRRWPTTARAADAYRVPLYPLAPLVLTASGMAMVVAAGQYAIAQRSSLALWTVGAWWAAGVVSSGFILGLVDHRARNRR